MRPEGRAEPGVEDVGVLGQTVIRAEFVAREIRLGAHEPAPRFPGPPRDVVAAGEGGPQVILGGGGAMPDRDAVAPPELPADAPVALLAQPVQVALGV